MPELYTAPSSVQDADAATLWGCCWCHNTEQHSNDHFYWLTYPSLPPPPHGANFWMWKTAQAAPCQRSVMLPDSVSGERRWLLRLKMFFFFFKTGRPQAAVGRRWYKTSEYESRKSNHDMCGERTALLALPRMRNEIKKLRDVLRLTVIEHSAQKKWTHFFFLSLIVVIQNTRADDLCEDMKIN